jgi:hypothetical protein
MTIRKSVPKKRAIRAKDCFWRVVEDCLVEFHQLARPDAQTQSKQLRAILDQPPPGVTRTAVYHSEPFDVACNVAGRELDLSNYRGRYEAILQRHNW